MLVINNVWSNPRPNVNVSDDVIQMSTVRCDTVTVDPVSQPKDNVTQAL